MFPSSAKMALLASLAVSIGRRGPSTSVKAFSIASLTSQRSAAFARPRGPSSAFAYNEKLSAKAALGGGRSRRRWSDHAGISTSTASASVDTCSAITALRSTAVDTEELTKSMEVTHPAFEVLATDVVSEYGAYCTLYRHKKSGAELLSVASDDDNKVFGITFRTPPSDSTGVPHILEHSVLCGSRKYTTKDPFVQLIQGSLQTFLNAFTYPDRTCYVVASQNTKDFYNLINVYTDAVFHPRATSDRNVHAQEGWHLELEDKKDPLTYKGVVYNEMKGVYSSPDSLLTRESQRSLFPDNTYSVDSGGDPRDIPNLSFEQFRDFHGKFYHPANARIYFSGDDDVARRLEIMDEYLAEFGSSPESKPSSVIRWQKKTFSEPVHERHPYPAGADQPETHMVMVNWLLNESPLSAEEDLTVNVLDHLLTGTTSSILRKTLMESGLGAAITGGGLSDELLQATFSIGLKGIEPENVGKVESLIIETLEKAAEEGFSDDAIAASMNTIEFELREFNTGSFPKGLAFMLGSMSKWLYDRSPTEALKFEEPLAKLKAKIASSGSEVFQTMIRDLLINNSHRTTIQMMPSKTLESELLKEEEERLASIKESLSDDDLDKIIESTVELKKLQAAEDSPEDMATIPKLTLGDLKRETTEYPIAVTANEAESGVTVVRHELGSTSGIAYVDLGVDVSGLPLADAPLLPLFLRLVKGEAGAGEYDDVALSRKIGTHTGGVSVQLMSSILNPEGNDESAVTDGSKMQTKLFIRGKATSDKTDELFSIMNLMLTEANFDSQSKVVEMLKESRASIEANIQGSGHQYANTRLRSRYDPAGYIAEKMGGVSYLNTVKELLKQAEEDWPSLLARLESMRDTILNKGTCRDGMILNLTGDKAVMDKIQPSVESILAKLPGDSNGARLQNFYKEDHPWVVEAKKEMQKENMVIDEGFVVPTQVSYVGKGGQLYEPGETVEGSAAVVSRYLRTGYLWDYVRVIGGAYGGFCTFSPDVGFFSFLSYRDPNLAKTIDVYDAAADELAKAADDVAKNPEALETAIIGTIGDMDQVLSPDQKGWISMTRWLKGESAEHRQKFRDEVLNTKAEDFKAFAERLRALKKPSVAVVSSKAAFEAASEAGKKMELIDVV